MEGINLLPVLKHFDLRVGEAETLLSTRELSADQILLRRSSVSSISRLLGLFRSLLICLCSLGLALLGFLASLT